MYGYYTIPNELYHHGIKGQKWGVRRFQNPDGSLTAEGYQHWGLNPDGSRYKKHSKTENYAEKTRKGTLSGAGVGAAVGGLLAGPVGASVGSFIGTMGGMFIGAAVGAHQDRVMRKKIKSLLDENGKVYVKDL